LTSETQVCTQFFLHF